VGMAPAKNGVISSDSRSGDWACDTDESASIARSDSPQSDNPTIQTAGRAGQEAKGNVTRDIPHIGRRVAGHIGGRKKMVKWVSH
jgi:hypothetical protein